MNRAIYDSRFFVELFYSKEIVQRKKIEAEKRRKGKYVSSVVIHEIYNFSLARRKAEKSPN